MKSKSQIKNGCLGNSNNMGESKFLTFGAREAFNHLRHAFIKVPIFWLFDSEYHIQIKTNISGYVIKEVLS